MQVKLGPFYFHTRLEDGLFVLAFGAWGLHVAMELDTGSKDPMINDWGEDDEEDDGEDMFSRSLDETEDEVREEDTVDGELERIRNRLQAATPGTWWWNSYSGIWVGSEDEHGWGSQQLFTVLDVPNPDYDEPRGDELHTKQGRFNVDFIEHAKSDITFLLSEVVRHRSPGQSELKW